MIDPLSAALAWYATIADDVKANEYTVEVKVSPMVDGIDVIVMDYKVRYKFYIAVDDALSYMAQYRLTIAIKDALQ